MLATFIFVNVILTVKYHFGAADHVLNAFAVGLTLFAVIGIAGPLSGAAINPAVGFTQQLF